MARHWAAIVDNDGTLRTHDDRTVRVPQTEDEAAAPSSFYRLPELRTIAYHLPRDDDDGPPPAKRPRRDAAVPPCTDVRHVFVHRWDTMEKPRDRDQRLVIVDGRSEPHRRSLMTISACMFWFHLSKSQHISVASLGSIRCDVEFVLDFALGATAVMHPFRGSIWMTRLVVARSSVWSDLMWISWKAQGELGVVVVDPEVVAPKWCQWPGTAIANVPVPVVRRLGLEYDLTVNYTFLGLPTLDPITTVLFLRCVVVDDADKLAEHWLQLDQLLLGSAGVDRVVLLEFVHRSTRRRAWTRRRSPPRAAA